MESLEELLKSQEEQHGVAGGAAWSNKISIVAAISGSIWIILRQIFFKLESTFGESKIHHQKEKHVDMYHIIYSVSYSFYSETILIHHVNQDLLRFYCEYLLFYDTLFC